MSQSDEEMVCCWAVVALERHRQGNFHEWSQDSQSYIEISSLNKIQDNFSLWDRFLSHYHLSSLPQIPSDPLLLTPNKAVRSSASLTAFQQSLLISHGWLLPCVSSTLKSALQNPFNQHNVLYNLLAALGPNTLLMFFQVTSVLYDSLWTQICFLSNILSIV